MNEGRIEKSPSRLNVERPLRSDYLNPIRGTRMLSIDKWSIKIEVGQHNDRFISKAKPCLMEAICYGAPSISYVNALAAFDPIPISEVTTPSSSLILPSLGGQSSHMRPLPANVRSTLFVLEY